LNDLRNESGQRVLSVSAYSSSRPAVEGEGQEVFAQNRRIDLRFVMASETRQGLTEVKNLIGDMRVEIRKLLRSLPESK
jgi:hypothetical protein